MVEALNPANKMLPFPGMTKEACVFMGVDGLRLHLRWKQSDQDTSASTQPVTGSRVSLRFYYRDSTIYAVGTGAKGSGHVMN